VRARRRAVSLIRQTGYNERWRAPAHRGMANLVRSGTKQPRLLPMSAADQARLLISLIAYVLRSGSEGRSPSVRILQPTRLDRFRRGVLPDPFHRPAPSIPWPRVASLANSSVPFVSFALIRSLQPFPAISCPPLASPAYYLLPWPRDRIGAGVAARMHRLVLFCWNRSGTHWFAAVVR
jgi:hypothetical protein